MDSQLQKIADLNDLKGYTGLVLFSASWCKPCESYRPLLQEYAEKRQLRLRYVDADESRALLGTYGVRSVPTTMFFISGSPYSQRTGAMTELALNQLIPS
jgi:thioredoxin 1